jgi:acetyl esterase/lipase
VHQVRAEMPPTLLFHGDADTVTPYAGALEFSRRTWAAGNDCELVTHPEGVHGYLIFDLDLFDESMERSRRFLEAHSLLP